MSAASKELLDWAITLRPWQQDALRRLLEKEKLSSQDEEAILAILKAEYGISSEPPAPEPVPLTGEHLPAPGSADVVCLKAVGNVRNVNQLVGGKRLDFAPAGLTVIYGENGSGKSGYIRILRNACRSRLSSTDGKTHPILSNIYGSTEDGPASAELHISVNGTDKVFEWRDREASTPELAQIAVFDSKAAALYVDESNHIAFLPFNLDLPHKLNGLCSVLRERLEKEHRELSAALAAVLAQVDANTAAGRFLAGLSAKTTSAEIDTALTWTDEDENRCREIMKLLDSPGASAADLESLAAWLDALAITMAEMDAAIGPERVTNLRTLASEARSARAAANGMAKGAFAGDYLAGVGSDSWRRMYLAAREYSTADAYPGHDFPMVEAGARCVMCQQEIGAEATDRLMRFGAFVSGSLARTADRQGQRMKDLGPIYRT